MFATSPVKRSGLLLDLTVQAVWSVYLQSIYWNNKLHWLRQICLIVCIIVCITIHIQLARLIQYCPS